MMASCGKCGAPLPKGAKFCLSCGTPAGQTAMQVPESEPKKGNIKKDLKKEIAQISEEYKSPEEREAPKIEKKEIKREELKGILTEDMDEISKNLKTQERELKEVQQKKGREAFEEKIKEARGKRIESPHEKEKPPSPLSVVIVPVVIVVAIIIALVMLSLMMAAPPKKTTQPTVCVPSWSCGEWSECVNKEQTRECSDANQCGTSVNKPPTEQECIPEPVIPENLTPCSQFGVSCQSADDCCSGYCVHARCVDEPTFCGDGYCDEGEDCSSCDYDCGKCPSSRDLEQNVFTEPLNYFDEQDFKTNGYVIVRYFYNDACESCFSPVHIENQLRDLAASFKDLFVLVVIDTQRYRTETEKYAKVGTVIYTPLIRADSSAGHEELYGTFLGGKLVDGDIMADIAPLICKYSEYCVFEDNKVVRTYS